VIIFIAALGDFDWAKSTKEINITDNTILKLDFENVSETPDNFSFSFFKESAPTPTFYELISAIKKAEKDPRIVGIYFDGNSHISGAMATELHEALIKFKKSGKFIYSYLESASREEYFIALAADSIFIAEEGFFEFSGFGISSLFLKGLYDKIGIEYEVIMCEDFKSAGEPYKNYKFSDSAKTAYKSLITQRENNFINAVQKQRGLSTEEVIKLMELGITDGETMLEKKLADVISNKIQVLEFLQAKSDPKLLEAKKDDKPVKQENKTIAKKDDNKTLSEFEEDKIVSINDYIASIDYDCDKNTCCCDDDDDDASSNKSTKSSIYDDSKIAIICGEGPITTEKMTGF
jgi:protease-4